MEQNKAILIDEDLFSSNLADYDKKDLEYINVPDAVGIATIYENNQKKYVVYINNETGTSAYEKVINSFIKAAIFAREIYEGLKSYSDSITPQNKTK